MSFLEKVILITGASSGIGAATAIYFAELGAHIALVARNSESLKIIHEKCVQAAAKYSSKFRPLAIVADVTTDAQRVIDETIKEFGKLDVLVNNAGVGGHCSIEADNLLELYDKAINTNLRSVLQLTHLAVPYLIKTKGNVVNVSSVAGLRSSINALPYNISKAALDQFTKCISLELAPKGVRVNSINPAFIVTNFQLNFGLSKEIYTKLVADSEAMHPVQRNGTTKDCVLAIAFLASDNSSFITGTLLPVDGGRVNVWPRYKNEQ